MAYEVKEEGHLLNGIYSWDAGYALHGDAFTADMVADVEKRTGLTTGSFSDWWVDAKHSRPQKSWKQLVDMAIGILTAEATRVFMWTLYLDHTPRYTCHDLPTSALPVHGVSGSKRINADCIEYYGQGETEILPQFTLSGKDDGCCVEGAWNEWCMFACNVLASKNTELCCPELYAPGLANDHY